MMGLPAVLWRPSPMQNILHCGNFHAMDVSGNVNDIHVQCTSMCGQLCLQCFAAVGPAIRKSTRLVRRRLAETRRQMRADNAGLR